MKTTLALLAFSVALTAQTQDSKPKTPPAPTDKSAEGSATKPAMGPMIDGPVRACVPGENSPAGTVVDGYTKVIEATPFGNACRWKRTESL